MDSTSSSSAGRFMRPRLAVAVLAATATVSIGVGLYLAHRRHEQRDVSSNETGRRSRGDGARNLQRRNAVRRSRRRRRSNWADAAVEGETARGAAATAAAEAGAGTGSTSGGATGAQDASAGARPDENNPAVGESWLDGPPPQVLPPRDGQNIISLLFRVSEDNARRSAYVHRGCACNACGAVPIRGIRYRCANCADFDLCETCESQGLHIKTHVFYKIKVPSPPFGMRHMQPVWYTGDPDSCMRSLPRALMVRLAHETGYERQELEAFWEQWSYLANSEWREDPDDLGLAMDRKTFERCLLPSGGHRHGVPNLIHDRMFAFYDTNKDGLIGFAEFLHGLSYRKRKDKLRRIFDGYDTDGDGYVCRRDFLRFFRAYYVLYKEMHKEILDGLNDQVMNSVESHQLITGRQPLSSGFGREGRVPPADHRRMLSGKTIDSRTGRVTVNDPRASIVREDTNEMVTREDILSRLFLHPQRQEPPRMGVGIIGDSGSSSSGGQTTDAGGGDGETSVFSGHYSNIVEPVREALADTRFVEALFDPPSGVQDLPTLLYDVTVSDEELLMMLQGLPRGSAGLEVRPATAIATEGSGQSQPQPQSQSQNSMPPDGRPEPQPMMASGPTTRPVTGSYQIPLDTEQLWPIDVIPPLSDRFQASLTRGQRQAQESVFIELHIARQARKAARQRLHDRWKRRHFYLDEEAGGVAPLDWEDREDALLRALLQSTADMTEHTAQGAQTTEVRLEAGPDEGKPRLRPRSLSKVRLLDDALAPGSVETLLSDGMLDVTAAENDAGREVLFQVMQQAYNELLDVLFREGEDTALAAADTKQARDAYRQQYAHLDQAALDKAVAEEEATKKKTRAAKKGIKKAAGEYSGQQTARPVQKQALKELLQQSGYNVNGPVGDDADGRPPAATTDGSTETQDDATVVNSSRETEATPPQLPPPHGSTSSLLSFSFVSLPDGLDGTLPQFRPSDKPSSSVSAQPSAAAAGDSHHAVAAAMDDGSGSEWSELEMPWVSWQTLREYRRLDEAEQQARTRHGWGRLTFEEFERIFKEQETAGNRLDYLGSWIDFCIP